MMRGHDRRSARPHPTLVIILSLLALAGLTGCPEVPIDEIALTPETGPPPGKTAQVVHDHPATGENSVTLSTGVVMTVDCWDTCDYYCESMTVTSDDDSVIAVRPVLRLNGQETTAHVLIAVGSGTTSLTASNTCASHSYDVTVSAD